MNCNDDDNDQIIPNNQKYQDNILKSEPINETQLILYLTPLIEEDIEVADCFLISHTGNF